MNLGAFCPSHGLKTWRRFLNALSINMDSAKALNTVVGHEVTHILEGTDMYNALQTAIFDYAKGKGEFDSRRAALEKLYKGVEGADIDAELTADLVGDYLFTDKAFLENLSTKHRNVFQKIYDQIKRLCKMATAGSKEARQLEEVKKAFEEVYREAGNSETTKNTAENGGVKYSLNSNAKTELHKALYDTSYTGEVLLRDVTPDIMLSQKGVENLPMVMKASHIRENIFTESEARENGLKTDRHTNYHGLGEEFFLKVIDGLDNVELAYRGTKNASNPARGENYFLLVSQFQDANGNVVNVPVYVDEKAKVNNVFIDTNKISTVFGRSEFADYINRQIQKGDLVRIKNRATKTSEAYAPIAQDYGKGSSTTNSISNSGENVNTKFSLSDSQGRQLSNEQVAYFENSKVRDENGSLKTVYHGSGAEFTEFSYKFMGTQGSSEGRGFYFTDNPDMAKGYQNNGTKLMEGYLDIEKPLSDSEVTMKRGELMKLLKAIDPSGDDVIINYDSSGMGYPTKAWYNRALNEAVDAIYNGNESDSEILAEIANSGSDNETVLKKVRELFGYDGYIVKGKYDDATVYVAFESNQFKNVDNLNPTKNQDIRYSLSPEGEGGAQYGDYNVYGEDITAPDWNDIAPPVETAQTAETTVGDDIAPPVETAQNAQTAVGDDIAPPVENVQREATTDDIAPTREEIAEMDKQRAAERDAFERCMKAFEKA